MDEVYMAEDRPTPERSWREIAAEVSTECDPDKLAGLSQELIRALDKETKPHSQQVARRQVVLREPRRIHKDAA
jgi:hypothetical protein